MYEFIAMNEFITVTDFVTEDLVVSHFIVYWNDVW